MCHYLLNTYSLRQQKNRPLKAVFAFISGVKRVAVIVPDIMVNFHIKSHSKRRFYI